MLSSNILVFYSYRDEVIGHRKNLLRHFPVRELDENSQCQFDDTISSL